MLDSWAEISVGNANQGKDIVRFGTYELDLRTGELRKHGIRVRLQEKAFRVLATLLRHPGEVVTREELRRTLWPDDTFVDLDGSLNTAVGKLRESLGDTAENPRFVETLPRRGYRFLASVEATTGSPVASEKPHATAPAQSAEGLPGQPVAREVEPGDVRLQPTPAERSIAVLPFENLSADSEQEYFCDGMTEELINSLTQVGGFRVAARTSAFAFKGKHRDVREIGKELGVSVVVEGSVRKAGEQLRITAQLINVVDGYHLWSQRYDRTLHDVFTIQEEIARAVTRSLRIRLGAQPDRPIVNQYTNNFEAYNLYLKGLHRWHKQTKREMEEAVGYFAQATQVDPDFAPAYVGCSDCYRLLGWWGAWPPQEAMQKARETALKAVKLQDTFGAAHRALAAARGHSWKDWPGTKDGFLRALELNPADAITRQSYAIVYLAPTGRLDEAMAQMKLAVETDPLSPFHYTILGWTLHLARRYGEAAEQGRKALELNPSFYLAHLLKGWICEQNADLSRALESFEAARSIAGSNPSVLASLGHCHALGGATGEADSVLDELVRLSRERYVSPFDSAVVYAGLQDTDRALEWLDRAHADRTPRLTSIRFDPRFDNLRTEERFIALLRRMGIGDGHGKNSSAKA